MYIGHKLAYKPTNHIINGNSKNNKDLYTLNAANAIYVKRGKC